ncbi:MAG: hypothetical protein ACXVCV_04805 [Polyangia bacterium]
MRNSLLCALLLVGCAGSGSRQPAAHYAGEPFDLSQRGDRISGQVCGMDLTLDVTHSGDAVELSGFIDGKMPVHLTAHPDAGGHAITGALGTSTGNAAVDLRLGGDSLGGRVGFRRFDLRAHGDELAGTMLIAGAIEPSDAILAGRAQLAALPLDTQAALVPTLLTCNVQPIGRWGRSSLMVRIGGPAGALPHQSSSVYTHD